jgi:hypothetical protein
VNEWDPFKFIISVRGGPCDHWLRAPQFLTTPLLVCFLRNFIPISEPSLSVIPEVSNIQSL